MSEPAMDTNAITTQPLINSPNNAEPNVITNQPLLTDPNNEEQKEKKFSQFNPSTQNPPQKQIQRNQESNGNAGESCMWCCIACNDCAEGCEYTGCECTGCCDDNGDCCAGCCESGPSADNIDSNDVADCLECCGSCFEICGSCCND